MRDEGRKEREEEIDKRTQEKGTQKESLQENSV